MEEGSCCCVLVLRRPWPAALAFLKLCMMRSKLDDLERELRARRMAQQTGHVLLQPTRGTLTRALGTVPTCRFS